VASRVGVSAAEAGSLYLRFEDARRQTCWARNRDSGLSGKVYAFAFVKRRLGGRPVDFAERGVPRVDRNREIAGGGDWTSARSWDVLEQDR
jgi:hypothetical protein